MMAVPASVSCLSGARRSGQAQQWGWARRWLQRWPYWLLLLPLSRSRSEILRTTRLCLSLARREIFGPTWLALLVTWRQFLLARCGSGLAFSCVLRGGWECKECSSNDDCYDAFHYQLLFLLSAPPSKREPAFSVNAGEPALPPTGNVLKDLSSMRSDLSLVRTLTIGSSENLRNAAQPAATAADVLPQDGSERAKADAQC